MTITKTKRAPARATTKKEAPMQQQPQVLYVPDLARRLGRTEASIRSAVNRDADWLPPPFPMGRRLAWRVSDVDEFIAKQAKGVGK